jgi:SLOG family YspA-like protein
MGNHRILVTGSQDWGDAAAVHRVLKALWTITPGAVLVSGECPRGADAHAGAFWRGLGGEVDPHPADWRQGRAAGIRRSEKMVQAGADICVAFGMPCTRPACANRAADEGWPFHVSHGTGHCARYAEDHGIPVRRFTPILAA